MKKNKVNLILIALATVFATGTNSANLAKMNLDILASGGKMITPWTDRAEFYNETIIAYKNGNAALADVKFAKENFSKVGTPFAPKDRKLDKALDGVPSFTASPTYKKITFTGYPPEKMNPVEAGTLTYTYYIYNDPEGKNEVDSPLIGKISEWDLNDKGLDNGTYYVKLVVSNNSSSISSEISPLNVIFKEPDTIVLKPFVDENLKAMPNSLTELKLNQTYEYYLFNDQDEILDSKKEILDSLNPVSKVYFDMTGRKVGFYKIGVIISNDLYSTNVEPVDFEYKNLAPINFDWEGMIKEIPSKTDISLTFLTNSFKIGELISGKVNSLARDPDNNPITYGMIFEDMTGKEVKKNPNQDPMNMNIHTYDLNPGQYMVYDYVSDGYNVVKSQTGYKLDLSYQKPEALVLSGKTIEPGIYNFSVANNREIQNGGFIYKIRLKNDLDEVIEESVDSNYTLDTSRLKSGSSFKIEVISELKNNPSINTVSCVTSLDGKVVEKCELPFLSPNINTAPSIPEFTVGINFKLNETTGKMSGDVLFTNTVESVDPEGFNVTYEYRLYQSGVLMHTYSGKNVVKALEDIEPGVYDVIQVATDRRFNVSSTGEIVENAPYEYTSITGEGALKLEIPDLSNLSMPSFVTGPFFYNNQWFSLIPTPTAGIDYSKPYTAYYDIYDSNHVKVKSFTATGTGTYYFDMKFLPDGDYLVDLTVKNDAIGSPLVQGSKKTITLFNKPPRDLDGKYSKNRNLINFYTDGGPYDSDYYWENTFVYIKDESGAIVKTLDTKTVNNSTSLPLLFDSSSLINGNYSYAFQVFDGQKYGPTGEYKELKINNTLPVAPSINYQLIDGELHISLTEPIQPTDIVVSYGQEVVCDGVLVAKFKDSLPHIVNMAAVNDSTCVVTGYAESDNGYTEKTEGSFVFDNLAPNNFSFNWVYDSATLTLLVNLDDPANDPEKGPIKYDFELLDSAGNVVLTQSNLLENISNIVDLSLVANGAYGMKVTAYDKVNNSVSYQYNGDTNGIKINNLPPLKPYTIIYLDDVFLNIQSNNSVDPENKKLTYQFDIFDSSNNKVYTANEDGIIHVANLSKFKTGTYSVVTYSNDGVNKVASDPVSFEFVNGPVMLIDPHLKIERVFSNYIFNAEGLAIDDKINAPLLFTWYLEDVSTGTVEIFETEVPKLVFSYDIKFSEGVKKIRYSVSDGVNISNSNSIEFNHFIYPPNEPVLYITQNQTTVYANAKDVIDNNGFVVNYNWVIKNEAGDILFTQKGGNNFNKKLNELKTQNLFFDVTANNGVYQVSTTPPVEFRYLNAEPSKPVISILTQKENSTIFTSSLVEDPEGETVKYTWNIYKDGVLVAKDVSQNTSYELYFAKFTTGTYQLEVVVTDGANFVSSEKTEVTVFNEPPGTPVFNAIQKELGIDFFGKLFVSTNKGIILYHYKVYDAEGVNIIEEVVSENNDVFIDMKTHGAGLYQLQLTLSDESGKSVDSAKIPFNLINSAPSNPDFIFKDKGYEYRVIGYDAIDVEMQPITYRYEVYKADDLTKPIKVYDGKDASILPQELGANGDYVVKYIANDGVNDSLDPKKVAFKFINSKPTAPDVYTESVVDKLIITSLNSTDYNRDEIKYDVLVTKKDTGEFAYATATDEEKTGSTSSILFESLFGNGLYEVKVTPFDWLENGESKSVEVAVNWNPLITDLSVYLEGIFPGQNLEPGQVINVTTSYVGNDSMYPVTYTWQTSFDGSFVSLESKPLSSSSSVQWTVPTEPGEQSLIVKVQTTKMTTPVQEVVKVFVKNYPPESLTFTVTDSYGNTI
jgi:hypothetical protein